MDDFGFAADVALAFQVDAPIEGLAVDVEHDLAALERAQAGGGKIGAGTG